MKRWNILSSWPEYLSPEIIHGTALTPAADVYSLGWIFYQVLQSQKPFSEQNPQDILSCHVHGPCPEVSRELGPWRSLITSMTAVNPDDRPADAAAVLSRMQAIKTTGSCEAAAVRRRQGLDLQNLQLLDGDNATPLLPAWRKGLHYGLAPLLLAWACLWIGWHGHHWWRFSRDLNAGDRGVKLFHDLADRRFKEISLKIFAEPEKGHELWNQYLEKFSGTPFEGAAAAEKRNCPPPKAKSAKKKSTAGI
jgi:hypothetical protein